eukprot:4678649-Pyramimonas_sp.AAC.1
MRGAAPASSRRPPATGRGGSGICAAQNLRTTAAASATSPCGQTAAAAQDISPALASSVTRRTRASSLSSRPLPVAGP